MEIAILTDIHGNLPALEATLEAIDEVAPAKRWCLGDLVGYGAQPDECVELVAERCDLCLVGNHDLAVLGEIPVDVFSASAAAAVEWTRSAAHKSSLDYLRALKPAHTDGEVALYHASPRDPVWEYVLAIDQAAECMREQATRVSLIGHSHVALFFRDGAEASEASGGQAEGGRALDLSSERWLLNPGSVGQPRDGDPRAAWLELDTEDWKATYHRVDYEIDRAAAAIREAGLPDLLAERLYVGQ